MSSEYNKLITETFCDNAIRSVMMIDDDFLPYDKIIDKLDHNEELTKETLFNLRKAASLHCFFQSKHMLCDIDQGTENIEVHKIRKSDLIILDYHLDNNDPSRSIRLLKELRDSDSLNLVIIYTREDLDKAWFETVASLRGMKKNSDIFNTSELEQYWDELTDFGANDRDDLTELIDADILEQYILSGVVPREIKRRPEFSQYNRQTNNVCEAIFQKKIDVISKTTMEHSLLKISGCRKNNFWFQTGNIFVSFFNKSESDNNDADAMWNSLQESLHNWHPSFYRLIISEVQNTLENKPLSFSGFLNNDLNTQVGWLNKILSTNESNSYHDESLQDNLFENIELSIRYNNDLQDYINRIMGCLKDEHALSNELTINFARNHVKNMNESASDDNFEIYHSLNQSLSTTNNCTQVKTGTILVNEENTEWFVCVSPSCDVVPNQHNPIIRKIKPHRSVILAKLITVNLKEALEYATHSNYIFLQHKNNNMAFSFMNNNTPLVETIIIHDFDTHNGNHEVNVSILDVDDNGNLVFTPRVFNIVTQLRPSYAQRFQAMSSHHQGRIGVDFIPYKE